MKLLRHFLFCFLPPLALCFKVQSPALRSSNVLRLPQELLFKWVKTIDTCLIRNQNRRLQIFFIHLQIEMVKTLQVKINNILALL